MLDRFNDKARTEYCRRTKSTEASASASSIGTEVYVSCDGTLEGPDIKGLRAVVATGAKTIASGGISGIEDVRLVKECGASGVMLGKALYENRITVKEALTEC